MRLMISVSLGATYLSPFINGTRNLYKKAADAAAAVAGCCVLSLSFLFFFVLHLFVGRGRVRVVYALVRVGIAHLFVLDCSASHFGCGDKGKIPACCCKGTISFAFAI